MVILVNQNRYIHDSNKFYHNNKRRKEKKYINKIQHLFIYHNINIRLFSRHDMENA